VLLRKQGVVPEETHLEATNNGFLPLIDYKRGSLKDDRLQATTVKLRFHPLRVTIMVVVVDVQRATTVRYDIFLERID
jgi:hypothetical protein